MSTHESKTESKPHAATAQSSPIPGFLDVMKSSEAMWWPYRSFAETLLRAHNNFAAFVTVNRKLADEMRQIIRREQDLVMQMSEKMLQRATTIDGHVETKLFAPTAELEEIYDTAVNGIRELGKAVADAQIRSIETLRAHAKDAVAAGLQPKAPGPKAAA